MVSKQNDQGEYTDMKLICLKAVQKKDKIFPIRTNIEPLGLLCNYGNHISVFYMLCLHILPLSLA